MDVKITNNNISIMNDPKPIPTEDLPAVTFALAYTVLVFYGIILVLYDLISSLRRK